MSTPTSDGEPPIDPALVKALDGLPGDFSDFARIFEREIRPALQAREAERVKAADTARKSLWIGAGVGIAGVVIGLLVLRTPVAAIVSGIAGAAIAGFGRQPLGLIARQAKALIVEPIARSFDLAFIEKPGPQEGIYDFRAVGLVSNWDRSDFEDRITGQRKGVDFEFFESHLEERRTTRDSKGRTTTTWVTVFRGQCLRFKFHKRFYGRTLVTRDAGIFNRFGGGGGMQRASLEDPRFEKAFEVYTTDQVESRFILTPDLMQNLVDLENAFHGGKLRCAFAGGEMLLAVEGADLFEPGSMFTPLDNPERARELLNDFAAVFNLIDSISKARDIEEDQRPDQPPSSDGDSPWKAFMGGDDR